jgi:peroxygenase
MVIQIPSKIVLSLALVAVLSIALPRAAQAARQPPLIPWDEMSSLQRHVAFFDYDGDGYITPYEDWAGLCAIGIDPASAAVFSGIIQTALATPTRGFPSLVIDVRTIPAALHGSDTQIWDSEGHFVPAEFERLFAVWDLDGDGGLDALELTARTIGDSDLWDIFGTAASGAEFGLLFAVAAEDGRISHDHMLAFYDGSLFFELAEEREGAWPWSWWWS